MQNGSSVPYATVKLNEFQFIENTTILYLGSSRIKPADMVARYGKM
jgi:hypothetical protein